MLDILDQGEPMSETDVLYCLTRARNFVHRIISEEEDGPIPPGVGLFWLQNSARFFIDARPSMRYGDVLNVLRGIFDLHHTYGFREVTCDIVDRFRGDLGWAFLQNTGNRYASNDLDLHREIQKSLKIVLRCHRTLLSHGLYLAQTSKSSLPPTEAR